MLVDMLALKHEFSIVFRSINSKDADCDSVNTSTPKHYYNNAVLVYMVKREPSKLKKRIRVPYAAPNNDVSIITYEVFLNKRND